MIGTQNYIDEFFCLRFFCQGRKDLSSQVTTYKVYLIIIFHLIFVKKKMYGISLARTPQLL